MGHWPFNSVEERRLIRGKILYVPQIGDILIPVNKNIKECCVKFYCLELDREIRIRDLILKISHSRRNAHLQCWSYYKDLYDKLGWKHVGNSDTSYNHSYDILGARMLWKPKEVRILKNFIDQPV